MSRALESLKCSLDLAPYLPSPLSQDLGEAKSLKKPPAGVDDITAVIIILLEGNPKDKSWGAACKLMNNVDKFLDRLKGFKAIIDEGKLAKKTVEATRVYLALEHFNRCGLLLCSAYHFLGDALSASGAVSWSPFVWCLS